MLMYHRITLEDDSEDEDLDVEPAPRRPVLVISDSLKEGLQRGISDILPHTVAQSVYVLIFLLEHLLYTMTKITLYSLIHYSIYNVHPVGHSVVSRKLRVGTGFGPNYNVDC